MMKKPLYELGPLRAAVMQCHLNIDAFRKAIDKEKEKIMELDVHIKAWEAYNKEQRSEGAAADDQLRQSQ